jgi:hypothetical protein
MNLTYSELLLPKFQLSSFFSIVQDASKNPSYKTLRNILLFYGEVLSAPRPDPNFRYLQAVFYIRNLKSFLMQN